MTTDFSTNKDRDARRAAERLLRRGEATVSEIARASGMSRQLVQYWANHPETPDAKAADHRQIRQQRVAQLWLLTLAIVTGKPSKRMTKAEMRADSEKAVAAFNKKRRR